MRDRYSPLNGSARVFRLARRGGGHLPSGHRLPKPEWLEPNDPDKSAAATSGRTPGISVWDAAYASVEDACWFRNIPRSSQEAFGATVQAILDVGAGHARAMGVVVDPETVPTGEARWQALDESARARLTMAAEGHSLIEGISKPSGVARPDHRAFLDALVRTFQPHHP